LEKAKGVNLEESELKFAEVLLEQEKEKERALALVRKTLENTQAVDMTDIEALRSAKQTLQDALKEAKAAGISEESLQQADTRRKKLHNTIEDLKGSIRVFCRVRPLSQREEELGDTKVTKLIDTTTLKVEAMPPAQPAQYCFDAVFLPGSQEEVFEDCRDLVQSALDGYNVTMFAYGQTGAGKTFTMYGDGTPGHEGTCPRTISELFSLIHRDEGRFNHTVMASMMELYRNELVDLLVEKEKGQGSGSPARRARSFSTVVEPKLLKIQTDPRTQDIHIEGLTEEVCADADSLSNLLERGNKQRSVAATLMNSESSRSHLLLMIRIVRVNIETHKQVQGKILMCDLAGSERLKKSDVKGDMQKESIEINKSLTALGDVIEALTTGKPHVPYKNHKLTQVMKDALGGTSKTLMFVNCSPASSNFDETTNALKYATRAKHITNDTKGKGRGRQSMTIL